VDEIPLYRLIAPAVGSRAPSDLRRRAAGTADRCPVAAFPQAMRVSRRHESDVWKHCQEYRVVPIAETRNMPTTSRRSRSARPPRPVQPRRPRISSRYSTEARPNPRNHE
jgi:hypothetical protein